MDPLVQGAVRSLMYSEKLQEAFENATMLLWYAFPKRDPASKQTHLEREMCAALVPHVLGLNDEFPGQWEDN